VHQADQPALLRVPERDLCLKCHQPVLADLQAATHVHEPLNSECGSCHAGHGGASRTFLRGEPRDLCLGCHASLLDHGPGPGSIHAVSAGATCLDCHVGHVGATRALLAGDVESVCYRCHAEEIVLPDGRLLPDVKEQAETSSFVHEPVARGDCGACHQGHSSPHESLLARAYPLQMYAEFSPPAFDLCFGCHDARLATAERTNLTAFRDGDRNLHHVHTSGRKGRTCSLCHEPHASAHPGLTRDAIAFGPRAWRVAIGFRRTETGGACAPGCHQGMSYRNRELPPAAGGAANQPASTERP
jgi:predicted CXXCH cytochrome family protein